jgi:hypothetical protein
MMCGSAVGEAKVQALPHVGNGKSPNSNEAAAKRSAQRDTPEHT